MVNGNADDIDVSVSLVFLILSRGKPMNHHFSRPVAQIHRLQLVQEK